MDNSSNGYHISFFRPTTAHAKANRNMVIWLILIWAIAIFGFQILLRVIEKPTPEPVFVEFQSVWTNIAQSNASAEELQTFGKSTLSVLGKIAISDKEKAVLDNALSNTAYQLMPDSLRSDLVFRIKNFESIKSEINDINDPAYIIAKRAFEAEFMPVMMFSNTDVRAKILPFELKSEGIESLQAETIKSLPGIMQKYLVHNQSFLTDFKFLGFPFHYFYTAVFLLILFIGLCWVYCVRIDRLNAKLNLTN